MKTQAPKQPAAPTSVAAPLAEVAGEPYTAYKIPSDRLGRYAVLGTGETGGRPIVAVNIRTQAVAELLASAPTLRDKLAAIEAKCQNIPTLMTNPASLATAILAIINPPPPAAAPVAAK